MFQEKSFKKSGFTLVELLVVVAIIGLLIGSTLIAIDRYQDRASDTAIAADLSQVRKVAAMIYTDEHSYDSICDKTDDTLNHNDHPPLKTIEDDVKRFNGNVDITCFSAGKTYCVRSPLASDEDRYFCVDFTGFASYVDGDCCTDAIKDCSPLP